MKKIKEKRKRKETLLLVVTEAFFSKLVDE